MTHALEKEMRQEMARLEAANTAMDVLFNAFSGAPAPVVMVAMNEDEDDEEVHS